jgi:hypothetical protein
MAARKRPGTGRPKGTKNLKRTPLFPRGSEFSPEACETARRLALIGLNDDRIAAALGISESTLNLYKVRSPAFAAALHAGKDIADAPIVASLFEVAQRRIVTRVRPMVVDKGVEIISYQRTVEGDPRVGLQILAQRHPDKWGPRRRDEIADEETEAANDALDKLIDGSPGLVKLVGKPRGF